MKKLTLQLFALPVVVVLVAGCPRKTAVWVAPNSTSTRLVFGVATKRGGDEPIGPGSLAVHPCGTAAKSAALWALSTDSGAVSVPLSLAYGEEPAGHHTTIGPKPLTMGCYRANVSGTGSTEFEVLANGSVVEH